MPYESSTKFVTEFSFSDSKYWKSEGEREREIVCWIIDDMI
jgi:hypothetical protein